MDGVYVHRKELEWRIRQPFPDRDACRFEIKEFPNIEGGEDGEWLSGIVRIPKGTVLPLHTHPGDLTIYILSGEARVRLGARSVELEPSCAAYFPARIPHAVEALAEAPLEYLYTFDRQGSDGNLNWIPASEEVAARTVIENLGKTCWALHEEFRPWEFWEPSKGRRLRYRTLFCPEKQNFRMRAITYTIAPKTHYTRHFHSDPQLYYVLSGSAVMSVADREYEIVSGSCLHVGSNIVHGIDNIGDEPVKVYIVKTPGSVELWDRTMSAWTPVEEIYTKPRIK